MQKTVNLTVNGKPVSATVEGRTLLVQCLREHLGLTGTHVGCDTSQCGACVVHVDGESVKCCTLLAVQAEGRQGLTIEGVANGDTLHPMQEAFRDNHGLQCGFCTPGHGDERARPRQTQPEPDRARDPRIARRQSLPLYRLPQYRPGDLEPAPPCACGGPRPMSSGSGISAMTDIGDAGQAEGRFPLLDGPRHLHRRHRPPGSAPRLHPAQPARACADRRHRHGRSRRGAGSRRRSSSARTWRPTGVGGLPCGWQIHSRTARRWPSRRIRRWRSTVSAMSATRSPSSSPRPGAGARSRRADRGRL